MSGDDVRRCSIAHPHRVTRARRHCPASENGRTLMMPADSTPGVVRILAKTWSKTAVAAGPSDAGPGERDAGGARRGPRRNPGRRLRKPMMLRAIKRRHDPERERDRDFERDQTGSRRSSPGAAPTRALNGHDRDRDASPASTEPALARRCGSTAVEAALAAQARSGRRRRPGIAAMPTTAPATPSSACWVKSCRNNRASVAPNASPNRQLPAATPRGGGGERGDVGDGNQEEQTHRREQRAQRGAHVAGDLHRQRHDASRSSRGCRRPRWARRSAIAVISARARSIVTSERRRATTSRNAAPAGVLRCRGEGKPQLLRSRASRIAAARTTRASHRRSCQEPSAKRHRSADHARVAAESPRPEVVAEDRDRGPVARASAVSKSRPIIGGTPSRWK